MSYLRLSNSSQVETLFHSMNEPISCERFANDFVPGFLAPIIEDRTHLFFFGQDETLIQMTALLRKYCADHQLTHPCTYTNFIYGKINVSCLSFASDSESSLLKEAQRISATFKKSLNKVDNGIVVTCPNCSKEHAIEIQTSAYVIVGQFLSPPMSPLDGSLALTYTHTEK